MNRNGQDKRVYCVTTKEYFGSIADASKIVGTEANYLRKLAREAKNKVLKIKGFFFIVTKEDLTESEIAEMLSNYILMGGK